HRRGEGLLRPDVDLHDAALGHAASLPRPVAGTRTDGGRKRVAPPTRRPGLQVIRRGGGRRFPLGALPSTCGPSSVGGFSAFPRERSDGMDLIVRTPTPEEVGEELAR